MLNLEKLFQIFPRKYDIMNLLLENIQKYEFYELLVDGKISSIKNHEFKLRKNKKSITLVFN